MLAVSGRGGRKLSLWDVATGKEVRQLDGDPDFPNLAYYNVAFSPDGKTVAGGHHLAVRLWDAQTGKVLRDFKRTTGGENGEAR